MSKLVKTLTIEDLQKRFPSRKNAITQETVDLINTSAHESEFQGESLLDSAVTYESVMLKNKAGITEYLRAIKFCAYLMTMDDNYTEAYKRTFHDREFVADRMDVPTTDSRYNELTSAASRYRRSKLVVDILTYSQMPLDLMFTGYRYKAIGVLANEMQNAYHSKDRINAAKELLAATKGPENLKIELDVGVKESSAVTNLQEQLALMAARQKVMLEGGVSTLNEFGGLKPREEEVIEGELA